MTSDIRKRKEIHAQAREMIAKVYHFLREEYDLLKQNNFDRCDLTPLANVRKRTAEATGVSERTVTQILKEERESAASCISKKRMKKIKKHVTKKKLQNSDERDMEDKYEHTVIDFRITKRSELRTQAETFNPEPTAIHSLNEINSKSYALKYLSLITEIITTFIKYS